jgi:hypothetical protein
MRTSHGKCTRTLLLAAMLAAFAAPVLAQAQGAPTAERATVSPEARAVLDRMTAYLRGLQAFSIESHSTRDEVVAYGYKLQNNEQSSVLVQRPNRMRAEISGDIRNRSFVYDGSTLVMYSGDDNAYVRTGAPDTLGELLGRLLDAGVEMPMIDVLYQAADGTLTNAVRSGVRVGDASVEGVACDQLAFRQANVDWQLWVEKGARPLPRKIVITTRYEVGEPQYQAVLTWNTQPKIAANAFAFSAPKDAVEIPFNAPVAIRAEAQGDKR